MNPLSLLRRSAMVLGLAAMTTAAAVPAHAATPEYQALGQLIDTLDRAGYRQVEEIERKRSGRFEVEAVDASSIEHRLQVADAVRVVHSRADGRRDADDDVVDLDTLRRLVAWLEASGYRDIEEIAADDGLIEVEARNAQGQRQSLLVDGSGPRLIAAESESSLDTLFD